jgi:hypothetical protein
MCEIKQQVGVSRHSAPHVQQYKCTAVQVYSSTLVIKVYSSARVIKVYSSTRGTEVQVPHDISTCAASLSHSVTQSLSHSASPEHFRFFCGELESIESSSAGEQAWSASSAQRRYACRHYWHGKRTGDRARMWEVAFGAGPARCSSRSLSKCTPPASGLV